MTTSALAPIGKPAHIHFHAKPQPSFNKNFDLLIRAMHEWLVGGTA